MEDIKLRFNILPPGMTMSQNTPGNITVNSLSPTLPLSPEINTQGSAQGMVVTHNPSQAGGSLNPSQSYVGQGRTVSPYKNAPYQRKRSSPVWDIFYMVKMEDNKESVKCSLCGTLLSFLGSTTSMNYHIRTKHPEYPCNSSAFPACKRPTPAGLPSKRPAPGGLPSKRPSPADNNKDSNSLQNASLHQTYTRSPQQMQSSQHSDRGSYLCDAVRQWIVKDLLPVSVVEGEGFREMLRRVDPCLSVPPRREMVERGVMQQYSQLQHIVSIQTQCHTHGCLTLEEWTTSTSGATYISANMCAITEDWALKKLLLKTFNSSSSDSVAEEISMLKAVYNLSNDGFRVCVTNSPEVMGVTRVQTHMSGVACFNKVIQECVEQGLQVSGISEAVVSARQIVNFCEQGVSCDTTLHHKLGLSENVLHQDSNKWHTTYTMLQSLLSHREAIEGLSHTHSTSNTGTIHIYPSHEDEEDLWLQIRQIVDAMKPLSAALTALSARNNSCVSTVYPLVHRLLQHHLLPANTDSDMIQSFKRAVTEILRDNFNFQELNNGNKTAIFASFLDPRYKDLKFLSTSVKAEVIQQIGGMVDQNPHMGLLIENDDSELTIFIKTEPESSSQDGSSRPSSQESFHGSEQLHKPSKSQQEVAMDFLLGDDAGGEKKVAPSSELEAYLAEASVSYNSDPLAWWRQYATAGSFPQLARLAQQYLCIPATALPANSLLSNTTFTRHRHYAASAPDLLDKLLFLNSNMPISTEL